MYRAMLASLVAVGMVLACGSIRSTATADDKTTKDTKTTKDKPKDTDKTRASKDSDTKASKAGVIEITKGKDDKFRFFVRDSEGKLLAMSGPGGFATTKDAEEAISRLREVVAKAKVSAPESK